MYILRLLGVLDSLDLFEAFCMAGIVGGSV
jgi:hypothetical protein